MKMKAKVSAVVTSFLGTLKMFDLSLQVTKQGTFIFTENETGKILYITAEDLQKHYESL